MAVLHAMMRSIVAEITASTCNVCPPTKKPRCEMNVSGSLILMFSGRRYVENAVSAGDSVEMNKMTIQKPIDAVRRIGGFIAPAICAPDSRPEYASHVSAYPMSINFGVSLTPSG